MHCLPNRTENWLLKAALATDPAEGYRHLLQWQQATDFEEALSGSEIRLLPMVWQKYREQLADNPLGKRMGGLYKKSFYSTSRLLHQLPAVVEALDAAGLRYAFTKGVALHALLYEGSGARPMNDVDILVEQTDFFPAIAALQRIGYAVTHARQQAEVFPSGRIHACHLRHATLGDIDLHYFPTILHNRALTNEPFLRNARLYALKGMQVRLLEPETLFFHLLINYQFADGWNWVPDVVLLHRKYGADVRKLRPLVQQTGLYHATHRQLRFLWNEYGIGSEEELSFYAAQPLTLADRYVVESKRYLDWKGRVALINSSNGFVDEKRLTVKVAGRVARWYFQALRMNSASASVTKSVKLFRDVLNLPQ